MNVDPDSVRGSLEDSDQEDEERNGEDCKQMTLNSGDEWNDDVG